MTYGKGFNRLKRLRAKRGDDRAFNFDILMANPPFAGDIKESHIIHQYQLGFKGNNKAQSQVGRDILFIERNLDFSNPADAWRLSSHKADSTIHLINIFAILSRNMRAFWQSSDCILKPLNPTPAPKPAFFSYRNGTTIQMTNHISLKLTTTRSSLLSPKKGGKDNSGNYIFLDEVDETVIRLLITTCIITMINRVTVLLKPLLNGQKTKS